MHGFIPDIYIYNYLHGLLMPSMVLHGLLVWGFLDPKHSRLSIGFYVYEAAIWCWTPNLTLLGYPSLPHNFPYVLDTLLFSYGYRSYRISWMILRINCSDIYTYFTGCFVIWSSACSQYLQYLQVAMFMSSLPLWNGLIDFGMFVQIFKHIYKLL